MMDFRNRIIRRVSSYVTLCVFFLLTISSAVAQTSYTISGVYDYEKAQMVVKSINILRQSQELKPLKMEAALTEAAMIRAAEMAFRAEDGRNSQVTAAVGKRPNGEGNLKLIGAQYKIPNMAVPHYFLFVGENQFLSMDEMVRSIKNADNKGALFNSSHHVVGCGSYLSSNGLYYWVLYFLPSGNQESDIRTGQWQVDVSISLTEGLQSRTLSRKKATTNLTPKYLTTTGTFNYYKAINVWEIVNNEREAKGLNPLIMDADLTELAMIRAAEMYSTRKMTHTRPNTDKGISIIPDVEWDIRMSGENIARGHYSAEDVMYSWMQSPGHRGNILCKNYTHIGVGECNGYWVQLFMDCPGKNNPLSQSDGRIEEVTVEVTVSKDYESRVTKRKKIQ